MQDPWERERTAEQTLTAAMLLLAQGEERACGARGRQWEPMTDTDEATRATRTRPRGRDARNRLRVRGTLRDGSQHWKSRGHEAGGEPDSGAGREPRHRRGAHSVPHTGRHGHGPPRALFAHVLQGDTTLASRISNVSTYGAIKISPLFPLPQTCTTHCKRVFHVSTNTF